MPKFDFPTDEKNTGRADEIYMDLVKKAGLFGQAFYGHKKTRAQARKINHLWVIAMKEANKNVPAPEITGEN